MRHALRLAEQRARQDQGEDSAALKGGKTAAVFGSTGPVKATADLAEDKLLFMKELEVAMGSAKVGHQASEHEGGTDAKRRGSARRAGGDFQDDLEEDGLGMAMPTSSFTGIGNPKTAFDAMSRRSTAMSNDGLTEHGTPGQGTTSGAKIPGGRTDSGKVRRQNSINKLRNSNAEMGATN